jgi:sulfonate transport system substrate-binding protein
MLKRHILTATLLLASVIPARAAEPVTIHIGFSGIGVGNKPMVGGDIAGVLVAQKLFEKEFSGDQVKIDWNFFKGAGPATNEALANNQIDFAFEGDLPSLVGRANGLKTKIILAAGARANLYLVAPPDSKIHTVEDLKGLKVAQFRGTSTHLTTEQVIAAHHLSDRDIRFINMDDATAQAAVATKEVDAAFGKPIFLTLVDKGLAKVIYTSKGDTQALTASTLQVSDKFETEHPDLTYRVVKTAVAAAQWASDEHNRDALFDIWAQSGTPRSVFVSDFDGQTLTYRNSPLIDDLLISTLTYKAEQVKRFGLARQPIDLNGWFEPKYLSQALTELKLQNNWVRYDAKGKPIANQSAAK